MITMTSVSVVIAAYNARPYLERAIRSALAQPGVDVEVLVIDDCSSDDTRAFAQSLAAKDTRIKVLWNATNSGPSVARNAGFKAASGDWIAILDADDAFAPDRLLPLIQAADENQIDIIGDLPVYFDLAANREEDNQPNASGKLSRLTVIDFLGHDPDSGVDLGLMQPVMRRSVVEQGLWSYAAALRHGEDFATMITALRAGVSVALLRVRTYIYSTRVGAITGQFSPGSVTAVDYHAVADNSASLLEDMRTAGDLTPEIATRLETRISQARRQNRIYGWTTLRRLALKRWLAWIRRDPRNRADMWAVLRQKARGQKGLPT